MILSDIVIGNDLKQYPIKKIGTQVWMACNSAETKYQNGDIIPEVTDGTAWAALTTGALCAYNNDWSNVYSQVGIAPAGWHLPSDDDWNTLSAYLSTNVGGKLKETGFTYWDSPNSGATNEVGFNGRGGGNRYGIIYPGQFMFIKEHGTFWSSEVYMTTYAYHRDLVWNGTDLVKFYVLQNYGLSIRLIRNSTTLTNGQTSTVTDIDGNIYDTICIGTQEWMSANLAVTHYNDGTAIPNIIDDTAWCALTSGAYCVYGKAIQVVPVGPSGSGITADDTTHTADDTTITVDG